MFVIKILEAKPGGLPIEQPTEYESVVDQDGRGARARHIVQFYCTGR